MRKREGIIFKREGSNPLAKYITANPFGQKLLLLGQGHKLDDPDP